MMTIPTIVTTIIWILMIINLMLLILALLIAEVAMVVLLKEIIQIQFWMFKLLLTLFRSKFFLTYCKTCNRVDYLYPKVHSTSYYK